MQAFIGTTRAFNCIIFSSKHQEVFWVKGALKIGSKFTGEHPCQRVISIKYLCNFIETTLQHGCCPVDLLHFFRTSFTMNTSEWLLLFFHLKTNSKYSVSWEEVKTGFSVSIQEPSFTQNPLSTITLYLLKASYKKELSGVIKTLTQNHLN